MKLPNIDFLMNMTKEYLDGKIDGITYSLDFPHELDQRYKDFIKNGSTSNSGAAVFILHGMCSTAYR